MVELIEKAQQTVAPAECNLSKLSSNPDLLWFSDSSGAVVFNPQTKDAHLLNPRATLLLLLCDGTRNSQSVLRAACELQRSKSDIDTQNGDKSWLQNSLKNGLIISSNEPARAPKPISHKKLRKVTNILLESHEADAARRCAKYLVQKKPENAKNWYSLGDTEHALGNYPAAKQAYEKYLEFDPDNITIAHLITALSGGNPPKKASAEYVRQTFDDYAESFDQSLVEDLGYKTPYFLLQALKKELPEAEKQYRIADLGCGTGLMGKEVAPWAQSICGVDLSSHMMSKALLTGMYKEVHVAEITEWLIAEQRVFDMILAADVFVYFGELLEVFNLIRSTLKDNSLFAFSVEMGQQPGFDLTVSGRYSHHPDYIKDIVEQAGFNIVSMEKKTIRFEYGEGVTGLVVVLRS